MAVWLGLLLAVLCVQILHFGYALLVCRQLGQPVREVTVGTLALVQLGRVRGVMLTLGALPLGGRVQPVRPASALSPWHALQLHLLPIVLVFGTLWAIIGGWPFGLALVEVAAHAHALLRPWSSEHAALSLDVAASMAATPVRGVLHAMIAAWMINLGLRVFDALFGMPRVDRLLLGSVAAYVHVCGALLCL